MEITQFTLDFPKSVCLVLKEQKHRYFERRGNDLRWECKLTKRQATNGVVVNIPLLDGTKISFNTLGMNIRNGSRKLFKGMGMPITPRVKIHTQAGSASSFEEEEIRHGDLIVLFVVS